MNKYDLSVIIPVYNVRDYLNECLDSVLSQTLKNIEIIIVNDGSTDGSDELCEKYKKKYSNIIYISKVNEGLGLTRNVGIDLANGEYIAFLDSDDYVDKDYYKKMFDICNEYKPDMCVSMKDINTMVVIDRNKTKYGCVDIENIISGDTHSTFYSKSFLNRNNIRFISERVFISEDQWFNLDCSCFVNTVYYTSVKGYNYRYNENSLTHSYNPKRFSMLIQSVTMLRDKYSKIGIPNVEIKCAEYFWSPFEKCYSQEFRYRKNFIGFTNSVEMCENVVSRDSFYTLYANNRVKGIKKVLLWLLYHKKYHISALLTKIYLFAKHKIIKIKK